jgi:hypothetical protein
MAYLDRIETLEAHPIARSADVKSTAAKQEFSALEWSVIRLARVDGLSTIRPPGLVRRFYHFLIGRTGSPMLANERLEALRRIAVLSWHYGFAISGWDVADFLSAGFSPEQYELLVTRVLAADRSPNKRISPEVFA